MQLINNFLSKAAILMRNGRRSYWDDHTFGYRISRFRGRLEGGLWFRTRGCHFDKAGSCVMCDYGAGPGPITTENMVEFTKQGFDVLPEGLYHLLVSPIGSFLDEWEVPQEARIQILQMMEQSNIDTFAFETRADTVTEGAISQCRSLLKNRGLKVYLGLETADPWISRYCINKALSNAIYENAVQLLNNYGVFTSANILLGAPFLTPSEAIEDVIRTITWAFHKKTHECNLFPINVKRWTVLQWLSENGAFSPPSLWSLVEVFRRLGQEIVCNKIKFSWYKTYESSINVICRPSTCDVCMPDVLRHLDQFYETNDYEWIEKLISYNCRCKDTWKKELETMPSTSILDRTYAGYQRIGNELFGNDWWIKHKENIIANMRDDIVLLAN